MEMIMSGYRHHTFEDERNSFTTFFQLEREDYINLLDDIQKKGLFFRYIDSMGPTRLRSQRNTLICMITTISRIAIDEGVNAELSFALSDYYINELESIDKEDGLTAMMSDILLHYYDLALNEKRRTYTKPIASAVRYIGRNLHNRCPVNTVATYVNLEPHYFTTLFSQEVGVSPSTYIRERKLEEGKRMLSQLGASVTETAESLGFCDVSHFSRNFKQFYGISPSDLNHRDLPRVDMNQRT